MSLTLIWPFNDIQGQILSGKLKGHIWLTICYFIQTFIIRCTVSEILAKIDHKGPNWTFLTLKMTFRVIPYLSYFRAGLVFINKEATWCNKFGQHFVTNWIISIIMGKWAKSDLSTLKMTFWIIQWNPSLDSWSISSPRSCIQEIKKSYQNAFEKIGKTYQNSKIWPFSDLSALWKWHLEWFNRIHLLTVH